MFYLCLPNNFRNFHIIDKQTKMENTSNDIFPLQYLNPIQPQNTKQNILQVSQIKTVKEILVKCQLYFKLLSKLSFSEVTKTAEHSFSYAVTILQCKMIPQIVDGQYKAFVNNSGLGLSSNTEEVTFTTSFVFLCKIYSQKKKSSLIYYNELSLQIYLKYQAA